jgi:uncharacterized membrane protein
VKDLIVLGFASRDLAEQARDLGAQLREQGVLDLDSAALAYCRQDGQIELVQPLRLAREGAASGALFGGLMGLAILAPLIGAVVGAAAGLAGAGLSSVILDAMFVHKVKEVLEPGRAALFLVVGGATDPALTIDALKPLSPQVIRTTLDERTERQLIAAFTQSPDASRQTEANSTSGVSRP